MAILITGGAGYIGSHTMVEFLSAGRELVVVDNFMNSKPEALRRVKELTGKSFRFYEVDLLDKNALEKVFQENQIEACIHFAGLKAVGESCEKPLLYYHNNIKPKPEEAGKSASGKTIWRCTICGYEYEGEELLARAFCHETDHLDGNMFMRLVDEWVEIEKN